MKHLNNKKDNLRHVFDKVPGLFRYNAVVDDLFDLFYEKDSKIIVDEQSEKSKLHQTPYNSRTRNFCLRIGISNRNSPLEVIWSILHEYGHLLQPPPTDLQQTDGTSEKYEREKDAWCKAKDKLNQYKELSSYLSDFQAYREISENSYKPK